MDLAPHWSRLRNPMIMRVYNNVILGLPTAHWSGHSWMNCWCPTDWPHTVGPTCIRLLPSHWSAQPHGHQQRHLPTFILFYVTDQRRTTRLRRLWSLQTAAETGSFLWPSVKLILDWLPLEMIKTASNIVYQRTMSMSIINSIWHN